jgi:hypothetical protein
LLKGKKSAITSNDLANKFEDVLPDIERLSRMPVPESLKLAWDTIWMAANSSFVEESAGYGDRGSDDPADELLEKIALLSKETKSGWNWKQDMKEMAAARKEMGG